MSQEQIVFLAKTECIASAASPYYVVPDAINFGTVIIAFFWIPESSQHWIKSGDQLRPNCPRLLLLMTLTGHKI